MKQKGQCKLVQNRVHNSYICYMTESYAITIHCVIVLNGRSPCRSAAPNLFFPRENQSVASCGCMAWVMMRADGQIC